LPHRQASRKATPFPSLQVSRSYRSKSRDNNHPRRVRRADHLRVARTVDPTCIGPVKSPPIQVESPYDGALHDAGTREPRRLSQKAGGMTPADSISSEMLHDAASALSSTQDVCQHLDILQS